MGQSIYGLENGRIPAELPQQVDRGRAYLGDPPWRLVLRHRSQNMEGKIGRQQDVRDRNPANRRGSRLAEPTKQRT